MPYLLNSEIWFPDPALANEDGLLAIGGDLRPERLILAYQNGIFPWFSDDTPILWYSPHRRFVIYPSKIKITRRMQRLLRSARFTVTSNKAFGDVIAACAGINRPGQQGTWITAGMQEAYINLHKLGHAHSVEVWENNELAGGMYGVEVNKRLFCGESMFSRVSNASKTALIWLCRQGGYGLIDCQFHTPHLENLGGEFISREQYMTFMKGVRTRSKD